MTVSVMRATPRDAPDLHVLEQELFPQDAWSLSLFDAELRHPDSFYLCARDDATGALVGYGGLRAPRFAGGQGDIQTLAVAKDFRRRGIGAQILGELLSEAWSRGAAEVFLDVRADNPGARALYEEYGFHEISRRPGYYQPGSIDAVVMRCVRGGDHHGVG